jgi:hypothetical protein
VSVPPLVITGMHRSGTSVTARLLEHAGLDLGGRLMPPGLDNPVGYYEDLDFYELNRALIAAGLAGQPERAPEWAHADRIDAARLAPLRPRGAALLAEHGAGPRPWGFKDPRTTMLLDFYDDLAPDARYVFVYREPWDVVASLFRSQERPLRGRADVAVAAWVAYNARLLDFRDRHPGRTVLVHVDAVADRAEALVALVQAQTAALAPGTVLDAAGADGAFVDELLVRTPATSVLAELLTADHPEAVALYARLEAAADLPAAGAPPAPSPPPVAVELTRGPLPLSGVLVGAGAADLPDAQFVARPAAGAPRCAAADAGIGQVPGDVVVVFDGDPRPDALTGAAAALRSDPRLGALLLAADPGGAGGESDLLGAPEAGGAIVLRREAWLATRGFTALDCPAGYEPWAFAVGCAARGIKVLRVPGAVERPRTAITNDDAWGQVLVRHPTLTARRMVRVQGERDALAVQLTALQEEQAGRIERLQAAGAQRALDAEAERDRVAGQLAQLRGTRAWRLVTLWWRLRGGAPTR